MAENTERKKIDPGELAFLVQNQKERAWYYQQIGALTHQIRSCEMQREEAYGKLEHINREFEAFQKRLNAKYTFNGMTPIDPETGEYDG